MLHQGHGEGTGDPLMKQQRGLRLMLLAAVLSAIAGALGWGAVQREHRSPAAGKLHVDPTSSVSAASPPDHSGTLADPSPVADGEGPAIVSGSPSWAPRSAPAERERRAGALREQLAEARRVGDEPRAEFLVHLLARLGTEPAGSPDAGIRGAGTEP